VEISLGRLVRIAHVTVDTTDGYAEVDSEGPAAHPPEGITMFTAATGVAAVLATAIITLAAEPAAADPGPLLPLPAISAIDLLPDADSTTESTASETSAASSTTAPASTKTTKTSTKTTGETVKRTKASRPSLAVHQPAAPGVATPTPTLRRATPSPTPQHRGEEVAAPSTEPNDQRDLIGLLPLLNFALIATAFTLAAVKAVRSKRRPGCSEARAVGVVRAFPASVYGPARPGTWSDTLEPPIYETARILPRGDDSGFADRWLEARRGS